MKLTHPAHFHLLELSLCPSSFISLSCCVYGLFLVSVAFGSLSPYAIYEARRVYGYNNLRNAERIKINTRMDYILCRN